MLFRKKLPRECIYCAYATRLNDDEVLCMKRGIRSISKACRKFRYDPCKRVPVKAKAPDFTEYKNEDFIL